jgi:hypothetical protein
LFFTFIIIIIIVFVENVRFSTTLPNVAGEWLALPIRFRKAQGSYLGLKTG